MSARRPGGGRSGSPTDSRRRRRNAGKTLSIAPAACGRWTRRDLERPRRRTPRRRRKSGARRHRWFGTRERRLVARVRRERLAGARDEYSAGSQADVTTRRVPRDDVQKLLPRVRRKSAGRCRRDRRGSAKVGFTEMAMSSTASPTARRSSRTSQGSRTAIVKTRRRTLNM